MFLTLNVVSFFKIRYNDTGDNMVNYPTKKRLQSTVSITQANRGMSLEDDLNQSNAYYLVHNIANVHKKPTPVQVVQVQYPSRNKAKIVEAYYKKPSTTDYNGVYKSKAIDFEAKETNHATSFALNNIHQHQLDHLKNVQLHGALAFLIIRFSRYNETYLLFYNQLEEFLNSTSRKSIPREYIQNHGIVIPYTHIPPLDYLKIIDEEIKRSSL